MGWVVGLEGEAGVCTDRLCVLFPFAAWRSSLEDPYWLDTHEDRKKHRKKHRKKQEETQEETGRNTGKTAEDRKSVV